MTDSIGGVDGFTDLRWEVKKGKMRCQWSIQDLLMVGDCLSRTSANSTKRCSASSSVAAL